jgi:hypothetical protein
MKPGRKEKDDQAKEKEITFPLAFLLATLEIIPVGFLHTSSSIYALFLRKGRDISHLLVCTLHKGLQNRC